MWRATAGAGSWRAEDDTPSEMLSLEQQLLYFFESRDIAIDSNVISDCHAHLRKDTKATPVFIIHFVNRKATTDLLRQTKQLNICQQILQEEFKFQETNTRKFNEKL